MKDGLRPESVKRLAANLARGQSDFDESAFVRAACRGLESLELKARVAQIARAMATHLPRDFPAAVAGLRRSAQLWDRGQPDDVLRGFAAWPIFVFIEQQGRQHFTLSLEALRDLTHLFTAEFSVRPFIRDNPLRAIQMIEHWTRDPDKDVRRLASEGIRPRLPWASRLPEFQKEPEPVLRILDKLKDDPSEYVRRSVANCLADVAVDHPDLVVRTATKWMRGASKNRRWILRRATRNLIKTGHPGVWHLHDFTDMPRVGVENLRVDRPRVGLGQAFVIQFQLHSLAQESQRLVVDYVVHHVKSSGKSAPKVFKWSELALPAGARLELEKRHTFREISTRVYYPGPHHIEVQVNGQRHGWASVELKM